MPYIDMTYIYLVLPAVIFAMLSQAKVSSAFNKYSRTTNSKGYTGADIARELLARSGITDVRVERINGNLTDHFDSRSKVIRLSDSVYNSRSLAAIGVAAHETGHAVQYHNSYFPLNIRNSLVPVTNIGSQMAMPLIMIGILVSMFGSGSLGTLIMQIGIVFFTFVVAFSIITLPVEFNASSRAIEMLDDYGILSMDESVPAKKVLNAAALTYVAAAAVAVMQLLRLLILYGGRRRD